MENQHKKIKGYRDLSEEEIAFMNEGKELAEKVGEYIKKLEHSTDMLGVIDRRWLSIGKTDIQKGFMCVIRAIARPESF